MSNKKKGNRGELATVKIFNQKFATTLFARTPGSGSISTIHKSFLSKEAMRTLTGDLITPPNFIFSIENKCGYDIDISKLFTSKTIKIKIYEFIEQSSGDAIRIPGKIPMVIYKKDFREHIAIIPYNNHSREESLKNLLNNEIETYMTFYHKMEKYPQWSRWVIFTLEELLDKAPKEFFFEENC